MTPSDERKEGMEHPDDIAVDRFAAAMKDKLRYSREVKGRGGWNDPSQCSAEFLSNLLTEHVRKGDPIDVANFAMMLHQRSEKIIARQDSAINAEIEEGIKQLRLWANWGHVPDGAATYLRWAADRILTLLRQVEDLTRDRDGWKHRYHMDGVCEIGAVNPNVKSYMDHWEHRAEAAEQKVKETRDELKKLERDYQELRDTYDAKVTALTASQAQAEALRKALEEAKESIAHWGSYAGEYFQEKHDLAGDIKAIEDVLSLPNTARDIKTGGQSDA